MEKLNCVTPCDVDERLKELEAQVAELATSSLRMFQTLSRDVDVLTAIIKSSNPAGDVFEGVKKP